MTNLEKVKLGTAKMNLQRVYDFFNIILTEGVASNVDTFFELCEDMSENLERAGSALGIEFSDCYENAKGNE